MKLFTSPCLAGIKVRDCAIAFTALLAMAISTQPGLAADWISAPEAAQADSKQAPVALQFRRELTLPRVPRALPVRVSADQRYVLYVNGVRVAAGPSRGDLKAWRYARIDLSPYLRKGANVIAAQVWSDGRSAPVAQITSKITGFYLAAEDQAFAAMVDSSTQWTVRQDVSRSVSPGLVPMIKQVGPIYYAAGGPETIDAARQATDWASPQSTAPGWQAAIPALTTKTAPWHMVADALPAQRYERVASGKVVRQMGVNADGFPRRPVTIAPNSEASLLIDYGRVLAAYPALRTSGGSGATITATYTEALYDPAGKNKGNGRSWLRFADRARVDDGLALGVTDTFKTAGKDSVVAPFWWRAWRFVELRIKTGDQPLTLNGLDVHETGYPFEQRGRFVSDDAQLNKIWNIGWRTALFDAHETYMDTAYWEQLQYIGDTRLQALLSYDVSGDPRLAVQAIDAFNSSRQLTGFPQASWPQATSNVIPPFALLWVGMLHDYWMRQPDTAPLTRNLEGVRSVLDWYAPYVRENGMVRPTPDWPFIDWRPSMDGRAHMNGKGPDNCVITMIYYGALRQGADLEGAVGDAQRRAANLAQADRVRAGIDRQCWSATRGLYADTSAKDSFSQHANVLAVLYDIVPKAGQARVLDRIMSPDGGIEAPEGIVGTTYYFSYYLAEAINHAGLGDRYIGLLNTWRKLLSQNFTTWPEEDDPTRSDSHAWSAHPTSGLLTYVAGIQTAAPGFAKVRITPHLGHLKKLDAAMAHPAGLIETRYSQRNGRLSARVTLPAGLTGEFSWKGQTRQLRPGVNRIALRSAN